MERQGPVRWFSQPGFAVWVLLIVGALAAFSEFAAGLALAMVLAVVCRPLFDVLTRPGALIRRPGAVIRRPPLPAGLASVIVQIASATFLALCVVAPLLVLSQNRKIILTSAQGAYAQAREWSRGQIQTLGTRLNVKEWTEFAELPGPEESPPTQPTTAFQEATLQSKLVEMVSRPASFLPLALRTLGGGAMVLGQLMFFFMAMHFFLLHGPAFWRDVVARSPPLWRGTLASLGLRARKVLMAVCVVHGLSAVSAFLLALPVFWFITGPSHFVLFAMLAGFFQFIPLLGSATLVGLMTLYYFASGSSLEGWECIFLAFPVIVGLPDFVIRPYLAGRFGKVHSMTMLAGFVTGFAVFGPLGFVLGPLFLDLIVQFTAQVMHPEGRA